MKRIEFTFPGQPIPFKRPRFNNGRGFNDPKYTEYKDALSAALLKHVHDDMWPDMPEILGDVQLIVRFYRANKRLVDLDNLVKCVADALQDAEVIYNDAQIVGLLAEKFEDKANPRVEILLEEVER